MTKRQRTPGYIIFYILFSSEFWRIVCSVVCAYLLTPVVVPADMGMGGKVMLWIMMATIGYAALGIPARWVSDAFKKLILGDKAP